MAGSTANPAGGWSRGAPVAASLVLGIALLWGTACLLLAADAPVSDGANRNAVAIEALSRLKGLDLEANPAIKAAVLRVVESTRGTAQFVELVRDFKIAGQEEALLEFAMAHPGDSAAAEALRLILAGRKAALVETALRGAEAQKVIEPLGNTGEKQIVPLLEPIVTDPARETIVRQKAVQALAKVQEGAAAILKMAQEEKLPDDVRLVATWELNGVRWPAIKAGASEILPLPRSQDAGPLPPVSELVKRKGNPARGRQLFFSPQVGCASCHQVNSEGVDFGPKLSEIGTKLGKDALYASILDPNAGISFGYESWQLLLKDGDEAFGLLTSRTEDEVTIKAPTGILTRYKKDSIEKMEMLKASSMPSGLEQTMDTQGLVDLVEYLASLKKAAE